MPSFILRDLPPEFWARVQAKAAAEGTTVKAVILKLLTAWLAALVVLSVTACGAVNPASPTAASPVTHQPVWALSGQSNAVGLKSALAAYGTVLEVGAGATPISGWDLGQPLWHELETILRAGPIDAFIWWQGENNGATWADINAYPAALDDLLARVRTIQNPQRIVICGLGSVPGYEFFRAMQKTYTAERGYLYVASDDLPRPVAGDFDTPSQGIWPGGQENPHLTVEGYRVMAQRIAVLLP